VDIEDDIFYLIKDIKDPEMPHTLGELEIIKRENIKVKKIKNLYYAEIFWVILLKKRHQLK